MPVSIIAKEYQCYFSLFIYFIEEEEQQQNVNDNDMILKYEVLSKKYNKLLKENAVLQSEHDRLLQENQLLKRTTMRKCIKSILIRILLKNII